MSGETFVIVDDVACGLRLLCRVIGAADEKELVVYGDRAAFAEQYKPSIPFGQLAVTDANFTTS